MSIALTSPVTGGGATGLSSPTYTHVADIAPNAEGKQYAVTALGGTQTGVIIHSGSSPFTGTFTRPKVFKNLGKPDLNGLIRDVPTNTYTFLTRKGVLPLVGQPYRTCLIRTTMEVPAGADVADPQNIRAALSFHSGSLWQLSAGFGDLAVNQIM